MTNRPASSPARLSRTTLLAAVLCLLFADSGTLSAFSKGSGNPFGNNSQFPNDGTFTAIVRGKNLIGTLQFSTTSDAGEATVTAAGDNYLSTTGGLGSTGVSTIFYNGDTYTGNSQGVINTHTSKTSKMAVTFQADAPGQGEQSVTVQTPVTVDVPVTITENGTTTTVQTQETQFQPTIEVNYYDALYMNGAATCNTRNVYPVQKFSGTGTAELQLLQFVDDTPFLDAVSEPISITGVRVSNAASTFAVKNVRPPSVSAVSTLIE